MNIAQLRKLPEAARALANGDQSLAHVRDDAVHFIPETVEIVRGTRRAGTHAVSSGDEITGMTKVRGGFLGPFDDRYLVGKLQLNHSGSMRGASMDRGDYSTNTGLMVGLTGKGMVWGSTPYPSLPQAAKPHPVIYGAATAGALGGAGYVVTRGDFAKNAPALPSSR
jgi:hypothetical protein